MSDRFKLIPDVHVFLMNDDEVLLKRALRNYQDGTFFDEFGWHEHA